MAFALAESYSWTPKEIENLYLDGADFFGLFFWIDKLIEKTSKGSNNNNNVTVNLNNG